jgi:hypothetical protein
MFPLPLEGIRIADFTNVYAGSGIGKA